MADYVISDLHLGHERLMKVQQEPFTTIEEKEQFIRDNWNETITPQDRVYVLGDLGYKESVEKVLPLLRGYKILIMGNHDKYSKDFYKQFFDEVYDTPLYYSKRILLSHYPTLVEDGIINLHGHTHLIDIDKPNYFNVCVENIGYTPIAVERYRRQLSKFQKPNRKFLFEWYSNLQISHQLNPDFLVDEKGRVLVEESREKLGKKSNNEK